MDVSEMINKMAEFFQTYYEKEIEQIKESQLKVLEIDYAVLTEFDIELAQVCLEEPDDFLQACKLSVTSISCGESVYGDMLVNTPSVNQVNQVDTVNQVNQPIQYPDYIQTTSQKVLYLLSVVKSATQAEIGKFLNIEKATLSLIFSRPDRGVGLVNQGMVNWVVNQDVVNSPRAYSIMPEGKAYLERLAKNWHSTYEPKKNIEADCPTHIQFYNLPLSSKVSITDVRVEHLNKMISLEAVLRNKTAALPQAAWTKYECPACGNVLRVIQVDPIKYKEPSSCSCGRKGRFRLIHTNFKNTQKITVEDLQSNINLGKDVQRLRAILQDELCTPLKQLSLKVSNRLLFVAIPRAVQKEVQGQKTVDFDIYLEVISFKNLDDTDVHITPDDEKAILEYSASQGYNTLKDLSSRFAPNIVGNDHIKMALLLQQVSKDVLTHPHRLRMNLHLFGPPGVGKTDLAMFSHAACFKSAYVDVAKASSVGLTAAAIKDEFLKQWVLEAGALILAGSGIAVLDELDKLKDEMTANDLGEPMEKGTISIHKATIHDTLQVSAKVLGIGNVSEDYNGSGLVDGKVLRLRGHLIDRFDLLLKAENVDHKFLVKKLLGLNEEATHDLDFIKKYLFYAFNREVSTELSADVQVTLSDFVGVVFTESKLKGFYVSPRFIQSLKRLTLASAKLRLAKVADANDAKVAVQLMQRSFQDRGVQFAQEVEAW